MADDIPYVEPETFHKAVIFTSQPVPPYYYIDLWIDGTTAYNRPLLKSNKIFVVYVFLPDL